MEKKKKFFFTKEDNSEKIIEKIDKKQMAKIVGGTNEWTEKPPTTYTESTYVRH